MVFHAACGLDAVAIADVQAVVRHRILRAFVRRDLIEASDGEEMGRWEHGGGFSVDASVCIEGNDRPGLERLLRHCARPSFALKRPQGALAAYAASAARHDGAPPAPVVALPRCKDRDDQKFLELARDAAADWLVTADQALLRPARRDRLHGLFRILTPEMALTEM